MGQAFDNGSFSGAIGEISRNEINSMFFFVPYTTPYEPGIFVVAPLPVFAPQIYSVPAPSKNSSANDVLDLYTNFPIEVWFYFFISFCACSILLLIIHNLNEESTDRSLALKCIKGWGDIWYDYYLLSIDNSPVTVSKVAPSTVLWTSIVLAIYYGFHCILMNTLSADLSVTVPGRWIDTFDELLNDPQFSNYTPTIATTFNMLNVLSRSRNDSIERELYDRIMRSENRSLLSIKIDHSNPTSMISYAMGILKDVSDGTRAVIEDSSLFDRMQIHIACHSFPQLASRIKKSKDVIASAPQAMLLSHSTHAQVVKLFSYRSKVGYELGVLDGVTRYSFRAPLRMMGYSANAKGYQCADNYQGKSFKVLHKDWEPMRMLFFYRLLRVCIWFIALASIILFVEILSYSILKAKEKLKISNIFNCANSNTQSKRVRLPTPPIRTIEITYK